jgi:divalent metal cation (Fe/Co/Zn/Cd) transporter
MGEATHRRSDRIERDRKRGKQNLLCAYLAGALLVGLLGNALLGAWWLDAVVGLLIAALAIQEGREAWQGDACTH